MPPRLWKLMICQVIGWIAYFATHLYFTDFMATVKLNIFFLIHYNDLFFILKTIYNGTMKTDDDIGFANYKKGVTMGCWGLFLYSASSAVYACKFKKTHIFFLK